MFFILGIIIQYVTFPGVIVHELAHQLFCRWCKVPVFKVVYFQKGTPRFQKGDPIGYVVHEKAETPMQNILISIGPFIVNTLLGALIAMPAAMPVFELNSAGPLDYLLIYLGVSIAMHAFPSRGDAKNVLKTVEDPNTPRWVRIIGYPIVGLIYAGSIGSMFWLDLVYGIAVATGIPRLIIAIWS